ncbi:MAG TPA: glycosyltransferase [Candidatus Thermoplasmatota archaeon]|nr:glycosyltransferase [Candidatus Thermoplasmatota archaeon]
MNVAVLVTQFNDLRVLRALDSLLAQTRAPDAVLVADGGSRLEVLEAMGRWAAEHPRLLVRVEEHRGGVAGTRASALRSLAGKADVVAFLDTDEVAPPGWLAALVAPIEAGRADFTGGPTRPLAPPTTEGEAYLNDFEAWFYPNVVAHDITKLPMGNSAWRVDKLLEVGGFDERLRWGGEDYDINLRVVRAGGRGEYVPEAWVHHDQSGRNDLRSILRRKYRYNVGAALAYMKNGVLRERMRASTAARFDHPWERWNLLIQPLALARALTLRRRVR